MSETVPDERIRIFDRQGVELASFRASVKRSWAIGKEGRASFDYPSIKTDVVNEDILRFGNYLFVENTLLPSWVGVIDTPREWDAQQVTVNAFTADRLFDYRIGSQNEEKITASAGTLFVEMLDRINNAEKTIMRAGDVWTGGKRREETFLPRQLTEALKRITKRSKEEYNFTGLVVKGKLVIYANWYEKLGEDTQLTLYQSDRGGNIESPTMKEDSDIINEVFGYGDGSTWATKPKDTSRDADSIATYGLRQYGKNWLGVSQPGTISANNSDLLADQSEPRRIYSITALNVGDTFSFLGLGNKARLVCQNLGFTGDGQGTDTSVRILGMSYDPNTKNKIKLVVEEI